MRLPTPQALDTILHQLPRSLLLPTQDVNKQGETVRLEAGDTDLVADLAQLLVVRVLGPGTHGTLEALFFDVGEAGLFEEGAEFGDEVEAVAEFEPGFFECDVEGFDGAAVEGAVFGEGVGEVGFDEFDVAAGAEVAKRGAR